ncbi:hypothetical protein T440DRAFT_10267 [Plenodomus tracheiphilus IPT5]|uniref:Uncharacterized protein n=1 Tax=Plenodomus tracheiphilus IPT5 TaxID=1408161 RepID=A0A6A7BN42_9PLEO|nr:hypothetical protein T440DRAFT_10267 [Plenodomus tracheiphilus IPT5]
MRALSTQHASTVTTRARPAPRLLARLARDRRPLTPAALRLKKVPSHWPATPRVCLRLSPTAQSRLPRTTPLPTPALLHYVPTAYPARVPFLLLLLLSPSDSASRHVSLVVCARCPVCRLVCRAELVLAQPCSHRSAASSFLHSPLSTLLHHPGL